MPRAREAGDCAGDDPPFQNGGAGETLPLPALGRPAAAHRPGPDPGLRAGCHHVRRAVFGSGFLLKGAASAPGKGSLKKLQRRRAAGHAQPG